MRHLVKSDNRISDTPLKLTKFEYDKNQVLYGYSATVVRNLAARDILFEIENRLAVL